MYTNVQIVNMGLSKIGQARVTRLDPPQTPLEKHVASNYEQWKRSEITKHKWVFARVNNYVMTLADTIDGVERPYKYLLPTDCMRAIRTRRTEWQQAGRALYSANSTLRIDYIKNVSEAEFDPLFVDVLAYRAALESAEYTTQSSTKQSSTKALYDEAIATAKRMNAFTVGPEDYGEDDASFDFITSRYI